jgi:hypothetical protein
VGNDGVGRWDVLGKVENKHTKYIERVNSCEILIAFGHGLADDQIDEDGRKVNAPIPEIPTMYIVSECGLVAAVGCNTGHFCQLYKSKGGWIPGIDLPLTTIGGYSKRLWQNELAYAVKMAINASTQLKSSPCCCKTVKIILRAYSKDLENSYKDMVDGEVEIPN